MSWVSAGTDTAYNSQSTAASTAGTDNYTMAWVGLADSWADGYEYTGGPDRYREYNVDTAGWPNRISQEKYWIRVTPASPTGQDQFHRFMFYWVGQESTTPFQYDHLDQLTVNFAPITESREVSPERFMKFLERIGHDDDYLRLQVGKNEELWDALGKMKGQLPPWDPRQVARLEEERVIWLEYLGELTEEEQKPIKDRLMERWGIEEIPPITPALLDQIEANSRKFLEECLSAEELKWFDKHGHCKIRSLNEPEVYYIVKASERKRVERYVDDRLVERVCIHSRWGSIPALDTMAMKVLNIKYNEAGFLKVGNRSRIR